MLHKQERCGAGSSQFCATAPSTTCARSVVAPAGRRSGGNRSGKKNTRSCPMPGMKRRKKANGAYTHGNFKKYLDEGKWSVNACAPLGTFGLSHDINSGAGAWLIGCEWIDGSNCYASRSLLPRLSP